MRGSAQDLDHDGLLGGAEGLHRLVVGGLGEVFSIDLDKEEEEEEERNQSVTVVEKSVWCVDGEERGRFFYPLGVVIC